MIDCLGVLRRLASQRPVFHSEADFQHAFAWALHEQYPTLRVRLEYLHPESSGRAYLDVWLELGSAQVAIELKYKTRAASVAFGAEEFRLKDQGAHDQARYDFLRDISRVEQVKRANPAARALAIFLTNDSAYWKPKRTSTAVDVHFRLGEEEILHGSRDWLEHAKDGTKQGRHDPIVILGTYRPVWHAYSSLPVERYSEFRFLAIEAEIPPAGAPTAAV